MDKNREATQRLQHLDKLRLHTIQQISQRKTHPFYDYWLNQLLAGNTQLLINYYGFLEHNGMFKNILASDLPQIIDAIQKQDLSTIKQVFSADLLKIFLSYVYAKPIAEIYLDPDEPVLHVEWMP